MAILKNGTLLLFLLANILLVVVSADESADAQDRTTSGADIVNCNNLCFKVNDGICDDGGPGSTTGICPYASDCNDCGVREPYTRRPTTPKVPTVQPTTPQPTSRAPTPLPTTTAPSSSPTPKPTLRPVRSPTKKQTKEPTNAPTPRTNAPTLEPTWQPSAAPSLAPTTAPTSSPTLSPTLKPTAQPSAVPTASPTVTFRCTSATTIDDCCGPAKAAQGDCEFKGCIWNVTKKKCSTMPTKGGKQQKQA